MWAALTLMLTAIAVVLVALIWRQREFRARRTWVDEESRRSAEAWRGDDAEPVEDGSAAESGSA